jgi:hypothetical protein
MPLDATKLEIGPANVYLEEDGADVLLGYMGDDLTLHMTTTAAELTGAQTGTVPQNKIITGGSFRVTVPLKEISLENFARAFPNSTLTGDKTRVDFLPRVGLSLRDLAKKMTIKKIIGGVESASKADILIIPEASPVDAEITFTYSPTAQRIINATFEAWPDETTGRWAYMGDELGS